MLNSVTEKYLAQIVAVGSGLTTVFIVSGSVTDPVNVTKLVTLGVIAAMAVSLLVLGGIASFYRKSKVLWIVSALFLMSGLASVFMSSSPIAQGVSGG